MSSVIRAIAAAILLSTGCGQTAGANETAPPSAELESLEQRVQQLENQLEFLQTQPLTAQSGGERLSDSGIDPSERAVHMGGALRFNLVHQPHLERSQSKRGETGLDVFRLNVDGALDNFRVSAEYRFYSYMHSLHHGWIGYEFPDQSQLQFGVSRVPFGLLPYAAHNAWFGVPYYLGFADDYDMGVKYLRETGPWRVDVAFFKNEELNNATSAERYSYDLVVATDATGARVGNEEVNQLNARLAYTFGAGSDCETEAGLSAELGEVYNHATDARGDRKAVAMHMDNRCGRWNFQLQAARYEYTVANPSGVDAQTVLVGAFADIYDIPAKGDLWVANVAYSIPSAWRIIDSIVCYNDYSRLNKSLSGARDTQINTTGCAIGMGPIFTYVDYILAKNATYFGKGSFGRGGDTAWESRLNINIGYYW